MFLIELVVNLFTFIVGELFGAALSAIALPKRGAVVDNRVRGAMSALAGRVHNIGTEWSMGTFELSAEHLRFIPSLGIVGGREIDVLELRNETLGPKPPFALPWSTSAHFILTTDEGELRWIVPLLARHDVRAALFPKQKREVER